MTLVALLGVSAAVVLSACGGSSLPRVAAPKVEAHWLDKLNGWLDAEEGNGSFRQCDSSERATVGSPPSRHLASLAASVEVMCAKFRRYHGDEDKAFKTNNAELFQQSQQEMTVASTYLGHVRRQVDDTRPGVPDLRTVGGLTDQSRIEPRLSMAASTLAGRRVVIRCWSTQDWPRVEHAIRARSGISYDLAGFADPTGGGADLAPDVCRTLTRFAYTRRDRAAPTPAKAWALDVLAHESNHLSSDHAGQTEAITECNAVQSVRRTAGLLGASKSVAARLASLNWERYQTREGSLYWSPDCRPHGSLDLGHTGGWP